MAKIIIAFAEAEQRERVAGALEKSGIGVSRCCATGAEALRAMNALHDGVLVCAARLPDRTADELVRDLGELSLVLVLGKPDVLSLCEERRAFKLALPTTRGELASAVRMLLQLHVMQMPRRSEDERALVEQAKKWLISAHNMTEAQAHQALQRLSMKLGLRMTDTARRLLEGDAPLEAEINKLLN